MKKNILSNQVTATVYFLAFYIFIALGFVCLITIYIKKKSGKKGETKMNAPRFVTVVIMVTTHSCIYNMFGKRDISVFFILIDEISHIGSYYGD